MHEDIKRGVIAAICVVGVLLVGGASLYAALMVAGIAGFAGAIIGWGLDRLFRPASRSNTT
jgi:membrane protein YqaA with SNARE-associated domain